MDRLTAIKRAGVSSGTDQLYPFGLDSAHVACSKDEDDDTYLLKVFRYILAMEITMGGNWR